MGKNIKLKKQGFTIVELLVVIVVIGILAAITIVSYTGITNRAKGATAKANANSVAAVANAFAADEANTGFPTLAQLNGYSTLTKIPTGITVAVGGVAALSGATGDENKILYLNKSTTGACIGYWDFATSANIQYLYQGNAASGSLLIAVPTCT